MASRVEGEGLRSLAGFALAREDLRVIFHKLGVQARRLTGARYAAVASYGEDGAIGLSVAVGMSEEQVRRIGAPPRGLGLLGILRKASSPILLDDLRQHPAFTGFPPGHPAMTSFLGVPIRDGQSCSGAIYLANKRGASPFSEDDVRRVEGLAAMAGLAIQRMRLAQQADRAREAAESLRNLIFSVASADDYQQSLQVLADWARQVTGAKLALIGGAEGEFVRFLAPSGDDQGYFQRVLTVNPTPLDGQIPIVRALRNNRAYECKDVSTDEAVAFRRRALLKHGLRSIVAVPVIYQGQGLGAVVAYGPQPDFFTAEQVEFLTTAAEMAAPVLDARRRQMQEREQHLETRRAKERAEALRDLIAGVATASDYQQALQTLADWARKMTEAQFTFIAHRDGLYVRHMARSGDDRGYIEQIGAANPLPTASGLPIARALRTNTIYNCEDTASDEAVAHRRQALLERGLRSMVTVPISYQGETLGVVAAFAATPNFFSREQVALLTTAAGMAAPILDARRRQMQERDQHQEARRAKEKAEAVRDLIAGVATAPDYQRAMQALADWARQATDGNLACIYSVENEYMRFAAHSGDDRGFASYVTERRPVPVNGDSPLPCSLRTHTVYKCEDVATDDTFGPWREVLLERDLRSVVGVPVVYQGQALGAVVSYGRRPNSFTQEQVQLLTSAAELAAPVLDARRREAQERERHAETIRMLASAVEAKDDSTGRHLRQIHRLAGALALRLGLESGEAEAIANAAILHDIGKIRLPESILTNPGRLSEQEWQEMRRHPIYGAEIIGESPDFSLERQIVRWHHERWDGSGYPDGLQGEAISLAARIVAVADAFDAMTSERPYKGAWPPERALAEMVAHRGKHHDPHIVDALLELWEAGHLGCLAAGEERLGA